MSTDYYIIKAGEIPPSGKKDQAWLLSNSGSTIAYIDRIILKTSSGIDLHANTAVSTSPGGISLGDVSDLDSKKVSNNQVVTTSLKGQYAKWTTGNDYAMTGTSIGHPYVKAPQRHSLIRNSHFGIGLKPNWKLYIRDLSDSKAASTVEIYWHE